MTNASKIKLFLNKTWRLNNHRWCYFQLFIAIFSVCLFYRDTLQRPTHIICVVLWNYFLEDFFFLNLLRMPIFLLFFFNKGNFGNIVSKKYFSSMCYLKFKKKVL